MSRSNCKLHKNKKKHIKTWLSVPVKGFIWCLIDMPPKIANSLIIILPSMHISFASASHLLIMSCNDSWKTYSVCLVFFLLFLFLLLLFLKRFFVTEFLETVPDRNTKFFAQAGTSFSRHPLLFWWVRWRMWSCDLWLCVFNQSGHTSLKAHYRHIVTISD